MNHTKALAILMNLLKVFRLISYLLLDSIALFDRKSERNYALIVRLDAIGDFIVWLQSGAADVIQELRRTHQKVGIVANPAWADLARDLGIFDQVLVLDPKRFMRSPFYRLNRLISIRKWSARTVVMPRSAKVFLQEDEIVRITQAHDRVAISAMPINISTHLLAIANQIYTRIINVPGGINVHESLRNEAFADGFCSTRGALIPIDELLRDHAIDLDVPYFVIAPGAGSTGRQWPANKFHELVSQLQQVNGLRCVIVGGKSEQHLANQILGLNAQMRIDFTGQISLSKAVTLIAKAKFLIANETGLMHVGAWLGTPTIGLVGGGHFGWFAPYPASNPSAERFFIAHKFMPCYGCDWHCSFRVARGQAFPCVAAIEVSDVIKLALKIPSVLSC